MPLSSGAPAPRVSLVIPVFNKLELTRICVESLHQVGAAASFEIIVVDNGSTDGSRAWLADQESQGRLKLVVNPDNLGFSRGCNLGAACARGQYLLFLNNDMKVLPDWLDPMVSTLDRDPEVGIVGAKLLFPDNTIQHAGVALIEFRDLRKTWIGGIHLAYRKPASSLGTNQAQYNQVVTGACLLIRAGLFHDLEGFHEGFWNGNEDVDLCLRAGQAGWKVVYRPESRIYHFESQSGPERWSQTERNIKLFNERWLGRARPDYVKNEVEESFQPTADLAIGTYVSPRLRLPRPAGRRGTAPVVSVVVLTWNALDFTRRCLASLLEHTDQRHELICVDNGSEPDTLAYLEELGRQHPRVKVIFNGRNLGFAAGNNVGIAAARGDYVCLLNSDTVVTAGWLDALLAPAERDPKVGLVGPVTNSISGGQKLPAVPYDQDTLEGLDEFAAEHRARFAGQSAVTLMVVGFCLLMKKALIERIGGLDEGFGQGNYEDNDYCLRTLLAGFNSVVAKDSFVHHFGSRSFLAGKVDYPAQIAGKFQIFRRKWNIEGEAPSSANLNLNHLLMLGFRAPLYFHPLPGAEGLVVHPLEGWEEQSWLEMGEVFFQRGRLDEAERIFRAVLHLRPDSSRAANNLACVLWGQGEAQSAEAEGILKDLLRRDPGNPDAGWNLEQFTAAAT